MSGNHEDQMNCDRPDSLSAKSGSRITGRSEAQIMREARAMDPETAAINACVDRLENLSDDQSLERILSYLVKRYLNGEILK